MKVSEMSDDTVSIIVGSQSLSGWEDVRITRDIESCPSAFTLTLTKKYPTQSNEILITPGAPCKVTIGGDTVVTGYVDRYTASISADEHEIHIIGRGMCEDLVDCSAAFQGFQLSNHTIVSLAKFLAQPFGIRVVAPDGDSAVIPQFNVTLTETPYEIIERVARWANFLVYEDTNGNLMIAKVGDKKAATGFVQGQNVERADVSLSVDERYTVMSAVYLANSFLTDPPPAADSSAPVLPFGSNGGGTLDGMMAVMASDDVDIGLDGVAAVDKSFPDRADGLPRKRPLIIVSEQDQNLPELATQRTQWDMARRVGRSQQVTLVCDSWRDGAGALWAPNTLAVVNLPTLKLTNQTWLISSVTFMRGEEGTQAEITLMPPSAFVPAPDILIAFDFNVDRALGNGASNLPAAR